MDIKEKIKKLDEVGRLPLFPCSLGNSCYIKCRKDWISRVENVYSIFFEKQNEGGRR